MAESIHHSDDRNPDPPATGEEFATRLFSLVMFGVCATILMMIVMGGYW